MIFFVLDANEDRGSDWMAWDLPWNCRGGDPSVHIGSRILGGSCQVRFETCTVHNWTVGVQ